MNNPKNKIKFVTNEPTKEDMKFSLLLFFVVNFNKNEINTYRQKYE